MTEPLLIQRQRRVLQDLLQLTADRARAEAAAETGFQTRNAAADKEYQEVRQNSEARYQAEQPATDQEYQEVRGRTATRFTTDHTAAEQEYAETRARIAEQFKTHMVRAAKENQEAKWTINTIFDANKNETHEEFAKVQQMRRKVTLRMDKLQTLREDTKKLLIELRQLRAVAKVAVNVTAPCAEEDTLPELKGCVRVSEEQLEELRALRLPRLFKGKRPLLLLVLFWLLLAAPCVLVLFYPDLFPFIRHRTALKWYHGVGATAVAALLIGGGIGFWLYRLAGARVRRSYKPIGQAFADAKVLAKQAQDQAKARHQRLVAKSLENKNRRDQNLKQTLEKCERLLTQIKNKRDGDTRAAEERYPRLLADIKKRRDQDTRAAEEKYPRLLAQIEQRHQAEMKQTEGKYSKLKAESKARHEQDWQTIHSKWQQGMANARQAIAEVNQESERLFPHWDNPVWNNWTPPTALPDVLRFGEYQVKLEQIIEALPEETRLQAPEPLDFTLPALLAFPERSSMLFRVHDTGRAQAVQALQTVMLRFLTAIPPAKVRFTIIDPVGLGENFAAFMHLADYDEQLVASRIWTEQQHIEERLADMTAHMENVIQKYLRKQFKTIQEYNAQAGEVAEPYRILVVANFPVNFTGEAARRLLSIANSGASCGVYTLIRADTKQQLPEGIHLKDLEQVSVTLNWKDQKFTWKEGELGKYPLQLDQPPDAGLYMNLLNLIGERAKIAKRVEVNFDFLAPTAEQVWGSDSRKGIDVPLGRAGATKKQHLRLGLGTAQHVLIAGKTGSGKSTLLHALITNTTLLYSPEEIQLYLVDFKKGVEFKTYANYDLPHAKVVAIESEREFGLSVLQRLDAELRIRGERFRALGVHDLNAYREATKGKPPSPRILLIVDEFQEFFVEDDKVAQEAALLFDRLVRQGRAFGMHVLLGSQTLGGAYSLARSTIDQMAVRIALQCSEADANLILSKDNSAARLLSRPGEAIYNDANGLLEGNDLFQVVWLPDERRERYLAQVRDLAVRRKMMPAEPQIVFEGNAPADVGKNHLLSELLNASIWPETPRGAHAWLGEAIAIKDPTSAVFRPQSSSNLLMVGQNDEAALGIQVMSVISLAAQYAASEMAPEKGSGAVSGTPETAPDPFSGAGAKFYLLDGSPVDGPHAGFFAKLAEALPHPVQTGGWRELPAAVAEIAAEVDRRQKAHEAPPSTIFLIIYGLQRFRDLRKGDDDFGFSRRGEAQTVSPAKQFGTILREGPGVSVHTLIWCDTLNNVNRSLDRQALREFEMRVLFQMSVADSSILIDSPVASRLGVHRALFYSEDRGQPEKFRPYGLPTDEWLQWVRQQLRGRLEQTPV